MSPLELFMAGMGQGMNNTFSGLKQATGSLTKDDIKTMRDMDSALLNRRMGQVGSVLGASLSMTPVAFMPGANTLAGASLFGAGMGLLQPSVSMNETVRNAIALGLIGPASIATGRAIPMLLGVGQGINRAR